MEYFDSHAHYDDEQFNNDREELIQSLKNENVTKVISAGYCLESSRNAIKLAEKYPFIYCTVGISPNDIEDNYQEDIAEIDKILQEYSTKNDSQEQTERQRKIDKNDILKQIEPTENIDNNNIKEDKNKSQKIVAVGEIGLDYHYDTDKDAQKIAFKKQIQIANKYNVPIVIHTRDAVSDTLQILKEYPVNRKGVFHCCPFNRELVKEALKLGFYISFSGTVTFKNAKNAEEIVNLVPNDRFLIETDSPYLAPEPVRGTRNNSKNLKYIVKRIAEFKSMTEEQIAKLSYENTKRIFDI